MPFRKCPHMAARCPHEQSDCADDTSKQCHYITSVTSSAATMSAPLQMFGLERLSLEMKMHLEEINDLLESIGKPLEPR